MSKVAGRESGLDLGITPLDCSHKDDKQQEPLASRESRNSPVPSLVSVLELLQTAIPSIEALYASRRESHLLGRAYFRALPYHYHKNVRRQSLDEHRRTVNKDSGAWSGELWITDWHAALCKG